MSSDKRKLIAHLARRAGFGATPEELDRYVEIGYDALVDEFLDKADSQHIPDDLIFRRHVDLHSLQGHSPAYWGYRLVSTRSPLQEKIALFWHGVFATGENKLNNLGSLANQVEMFRTHGLGRFDDLLVELSKDPAMLIWLDNHTNHKDSINENYGREILELFSMGVGNYTEDDIKECARAFTGWSVKNGEYMAMMAQKDSIWPYGRIFWHHEFREDDHDNDGKHFLGEKGPFNGDDVVEIICRQAATARFISRHIYNFFVADEAPVPQWSDTEPRDAAAIDQLAAAYVHYDHDIRSVLRVLFNSDFFKESMFQRVKNPAEMIVGTLRKTGEFTVPDGGEWGIFTALEEAGFMGQKLLDPPSVEGWHTGEEWVTSGSLVERVNFASQHLSDISKPGVRDMVERVLSVSGVASGPGELVDGCLEVMGPMDVSDETRELLFEIASSGTHEAESHAQQTQQESKPSQRLILTLFKFIVSSREYQLC
jgi:uncharacterized protein (DUF1800 family)